MATQTQRRSVSSYDHGSLRNTSRVGRAVDASPLPLEKIRHLLRAKRMRSIHVSPLAHESGISRPMLSMIISDRALPGLDTLCLLLSWDEAFDEPVWEYMIERGRALRKTNLEVMAQAEKALDS
jgi:transcriptional regulator with XRE-family HTH domain